MIPLSEYITGERFANLAGVNYDQDIVTESTITYCRTHMMERNLKALAHPKIKVLITHNSDAVATAEMAEKLPSNILAWYSTNVVSKHHKLHAIPLGLLNSMERLYQMEDEMHEDRHRSDNAYLCATCSLLNPNNQFKKEERERLYDLCSDWEWVTVKGGGNASDIPHEEYLRDLHSHKYCLCPTGAGPDTHRVWESLYLGCMPIAKHDDKYSLKFLQLTFPIITVEEWDDMFADINLDMRIMSLERVSQEALKMSYWSRQIWKAAGILG